MKTKLILLTLALGASTCMLVAQDGNQRPGGHGREGRGPGGPGHQHPVMPIIAALDINNDGTIDSAEQAQAAASLKKLDKNGDGRITPDEYRPQRPDGDRRGPRGPGQGQRRPQRPQSE